MLGVARNAGGGYKRAFQVTIAASAANVNLRTVANAQGYVGGDCAITINAGVELYASSTGVAACVPGSWPAGATVTLIVKGFIDGAGGDGGTFAVTSPTAGGPALDARAVSGFRFRVDNGAGQIRGGGGGGGPGETLGYNASDGTNFYHYDGGGGGGGGGQGRAGGTGGAGCASSANNLPDGGPGGNGSSSGPGGGGYGGGQFGLNGYPGADGGAWGTAGQNGAANEGPISGGAPGYAVLGNANIVWIANGTRLGPVG